MEHEAILKIELNTKSKYLTEKKPENHFETTDYYIFYKISKFQLKHRKLGQKLGKIKNMATEELQLIQQN